jgi:type II secretory pathway pseudopilin PulG
MSSCNKLRFTLIELLMVITVILVLLSLLMPSFRRAYDLSMLAVSESNLHNIGIASMLFCRNNRDVYASAGKSTNIDIADNLSPYMGNWDTTTIALDGIPRSVAAPSAKVWSCPADPYVSSGIFANFYHRTYQANNKTATGYSTGPNLGVHGLTDWTASSRVGLIEQPARTGAIFEFSSDGCRLGQFSHSASYTPSERISRTLSSWAPYGATYPDHHRMGLRSPILCCDSSVQLTYIPSVGDNNDWFWRADKP